MIYKKRAVKTKEKSWGEKVKKFIISVIKSILFILVYLLIQGNVARFITNEYLLKGRKFIDNANSIEYSKMIIDTTAISLLISIILTFIFLFLLYKFSKRGLLERCKFKKFKAEYIIYIAMIIIGFALVNSLIVSILSNNISSYEETNNFIVNMQSTLISMIIINIVGPIFEEILFRGVIFDELSETSPLYIAIIIQGLLFAIAHGNLLQGIYTFTLGIILAVINYYCQSIWSDILGHILFNIFGGVLIAYLFNISPYLYLVSVFLGMVIFVVGFYLLIKRSKRNFTT